MADNATVAVVGGIFTVVVATISGIVANKTARSNIQGDIDKINKQLEFQHDATLVALIERYLIPLRYYGKALSENLCVLSTKFQSDEADRTKALFKLMKDRVTQDDIRDDYVA